MATRNRAAEPHTDRRAMVWFEDRSGAIARGLADAVTLSGALVRLAEKPGFDTGEELTLRICFERDAPTLATTARVRWLRASEGAVECELEWTAPASQRAALEAWLSSAA
jgi:PilZ domain